MVGALLTLLAASKTDISGSHNYYTPGSYNFTVPAHNQLTVVVNGAGGGGIGDMSPDTAGTGLYSSFNNTMNANGGGGSGPPEVGPGADGTASGGTTNTTGGANNAGAAGNGGIPGGKGGQAIRAYNADELTAGSIVPVVVGQGGNGSGPSAGDGGNGSVLISWD